MSLVNVRIVFTHKSIKDMMNDAMEIYWDDEDGDWRSWKPFVEKYKNSYFGERVINFSNMVFSFWNEYKGERNEYSFRDCVVDHYGDNRDPYTGEKLDITKLFIEVAMEEEEYELLKQDYTKYELFICNKEIALGLTTGSKDIKMYRTDGFDFDIKEIITFDFDDLEDVYIENLGYTDKFNMKYLVNVNKKEG